MNRVDTNKAIIRGVSVATKGVARGHDQILDSETLRQLHECAARVRTVPVKVDHGSGAAGVCGYLTNFSADADRVVADWHLLKSHPATHQILEAAARMPTGVGLSPSFVMADNAPAGRARCEELLSVDYVDKPASNPGGLLAPERVEFSATGQFLRTGTALKPNRGASLLDRAKAASLQVAKDSGPQVKRAAVSALVGAGAEYLYQRARKAQEAQEQEREAQERDELGRWQRRMSARCGEILFALRDPAINRLIDSTRANVSLPTVSLPGSDETAMAKRVVQHSPLVRHLLIRAGKVAVGAGAGAVAGHRLIGGRRAVKGGAIVGGLAGLAFESKTNSTPMENDDVEQQIKGIGTIIDQHVPGNRTGRETHDLTSLARRLGLSPDEAQQLIDGGRITPDGPLSRTRGDGRYVYNSDDLDSLKHEILGHVASQAIEDSRGRGADALSAGMAARDAVRSHIAQFQTRAVKSTHLRALASGAVMLSSTQGDDEDSTLKRIGKAAAVVGTGAALAGGAAYLRGRSLRAPGGTVAPGIRGVLDSTRIAAGNSSAMLSRPTSAAARPLLRLRVAAPRLRLP